MEYKHFLYTIFFVGILVNVNNAGSIRVQQKTDILIEQLLREANQLDLIFNQSQIKIFESPRNDIAVSVPLVNNVNTTSDTVEQGDVYITFQCMLTKNLTGCYRVRLTEVDENGAGYALVNDNGDTIVTKAAKVDKEKEDEEEKNIHVIAIDAWIACFWIDHANLGCHHTVVLFVI